LGSFLNIQSNNPIIKRKVENVDVDFGQRKHTCLTADAHFSRISAVYQDKKRVTTSRESTIYTAMGVNPLVAS
jgi:hypothetical protein